MGRTKQLLPWPTEQSERTVIASAFDAIVGICDKVVVVVGHETDQVSASLAPRSFVVASANADAPMFESIRSGLTMARKIAPRSTVVLHPADHPRVHPETLHRLIRVAEGCPNEAIIPVVDGRGGHPIFIPAGMVSHLIQLEAPGGLRQFWRENPHVSHRIAVDDPTIVQDLDTPQDYQQALRHLKDESSSAEQR